MVQYGKDKTPAGGTALGAAGRAVKGFYDLRGDIEDRKARREALQQELAMRGRSIDLAAQRVGQAAARFQAQDAAQQRKARLERREERAGKSASRAALEMLSIAQGGPSAEGEPPQDPIRAIMELAQRQASAPGTTAEAAADIAQSAATFTTMAVKGQAKREILESLKQDVASGFWNQANDMGIEIDADGDDIPDALAEVPELAAQALEQGADPEKVGAKLNEIRGMIAARMGAMKRREQVMAETDQFLTALGPQIQADDAQELERWNQDWNRGAFGDTQEGEDEYREGVMALAGGNRPMTINIGGKPQKVFVSKNDFADAQRRVLLGAQKEAADPMARQTKMQGAVHQMLGPYKPTVTEEDEAGVKTTTKVSVEDYLAKFNAIGEGMFPKSWQQIEGNVTGDWNFNGQADKPMAYQGGGGGDLMQQAEVAAAQSDEAWNAFVEALPDDVNEQAVLDAMERGKARRKK